MGVMMGILNQMTVANLNNISDPHVSIGDKRLLAATINTAVALIEEGAKPDDAARHAVEQLLASFKHILEEKDRGGKVLSPDYEKNINHSIKYFSSFLRG
jgi:hypothetical protein